MDATKKEAAEPDATKKEAAEPDATKKEAAEPDATKKEMAEAVDKIKDKVEKTDLSRFKKYKLLKPVTIADKTYHELTLDFDSLTGDDMEAAASLPGAIPFDGSTCEYSKKYLLFIAARAAGIAYSEMRLFPITDCTGLTMLAYAFLMEGLSKSTVT